MARTTDATIEEVRRALARLRPAALDEIGLARAIGRLADDAGERLGLEITRELDVPGGLAATVETAIYRIVQEALTNVVRHAQGVTRVRVSLAERGALLVVDIEDDGAGLAAPEGHEGSGLRGMRERAELLGGRFEAARRSPRGTRIHAEIPKAP
jgi:signal transduction histidine kinase